MRGALARIATAVTAMVALSFVVPLGLLVGQMAHDRALAAAAQQAASLEPVLTVTAAPAPLADAVGSTPAGAAGRLALHPPQGAAIGAAHAAAADVAKARRLRRAFTAPASGGTVLLTPALLDADRVAVIEVYVPDAELNRGWRGRGPSSGSSRSRWCWCRSRWPTGSPSGSCGPPRGWRTR
ncbi:hypothetical protein [Actinomadura sp. NTSP31]|uniref:hypothetical protein n=1 Tax=Actinomadura sp. NTSP31 TaxID=1735447 RepID=UPI0035C20DF1